MYQKFENQEKTSVDEDIECQFWYQITKESIKGLKNERLEVNDTEKFT